MDNANAPKMQYNKPNSFIPLLTLNPIIKITPTKPSPSPKTPRPDNLCPKNTHPRRATNNGMLDAIIAAKEASIHCNAAKFKPR